MQHPAPYPVCEPDQPERSPLTPDLPNEAGDRRLWTHLHGCTAGLAIERAANQFDGLVVVVGPDTHSAYRLEQELRFFGVGGTDNERVGKGSLTGPLLHFPDWETLPYDVFSPHQDIVSERLSTLATLPKLTRGVLVVPVTTAMVRLPPRSYLDGHSLVLERGARLDLDDFRRNLESAGYICVSQVMEHGEFAVRGSLLDMYPMGAANPYRIDLFDDEIDTIRVFDVESQRSAGETPQVHILPAREFPMDPGAITRFRQNWRARFEGDPTTATLYREVSEGRCPPGIEYWLPLFYEHTATLLDYLPPRSLIVHSPETEEAGARFWEDLLNRHEQRRHDHERPLLDPTEVFVPVSELYAQFKAHPQVKFSAAQERSTSYATAVPTAVPVNSRSDNPVSAFEAFLKQFAGRALVVAETAGRRETLLEFLRPLGLQPTAFADWQAFLDGDAALGITVAPLEQGGVLLNPRIAIVAETQLFGERALQQRRRRAQQRDAESIVRDLSELRIGTPVVHEDHGVGRYQGLQVVQTEKSLGEFLSIEYADGDKLYVPVAALHLVSRYTGAQPESAPLHKLGSPQWHKARQRAAERAFDVAAELLDVGARRAARPGYAFETPEAELRAFEQGFPFEETLDQRTAIDAVTEDMRAPRPMDRLVCGDVGFGKTEVAMRAAFVAVQNNHQVAVLVPTTLLAQQHHQTFSDRFAEWPIRVEQLSRFRSRKEREQVVEELSEGKVDIVIGTHKLVASDISFKRLGLVVIDEEHRFGVRHKERLKALRSETDVLTLTATPIPRTLNLALSGLRDLSLIATPPARRLSVKTFVRQWDDGLLREALVRELRRGGQIYVVHNRVEDIERIAQRVEGLVPEAKVRIAHGQMRERDLEGTMLDFYHRRFDVLVCTTIIETGIDVPNANTIIIHRADQFGLAQLHQLRGRVGRSHHRAYAYLVVPPRSGMTADAIKRLDAIESLDELGIGFSLATHDLEIRGAGELLGEEQSGQMHEVGYAMYTRLLERAVRALKAGEHPDLDRPLDHGPEVDLRIPALIPEAYLPDVHARLILYKRIASAPGAEELLALEEEMVDRFGRAPEMLRNLFAVTRLKLKAQPLGVKKLDLSERGGRLVFRAKANVDPASIVRLVQTEPERYRLEGSDKLRLVDSMPEPEARITAANDLLSQLSLEAQP